MFNFEQLDIDTSFCWVEPDVSLAEVRSRLEQYRFVVASDSLLYVVAGRHSKSLALSDPKTSLRDWISRTGWPDSPVYPRARLAHADFAADREFLIGDSPDNIQGVVTPRALIVCLLEEKRELASYLDALVETVNDAVTAVDRDGRVMYWNQAAEQIYGIDKGLIIGRKVGQHFNSESVMLLRILNEGRAVRQVYHQPAPNKHVLISASPIMDRNRIIGGIATEHDITRVVALNEKLYTNFSTRVEDPAAAVAMIGTGPVIMRCLELARKFARLSKPVLLSGEAGLGKETLALWIHQEGGRKNEPFLTVHCGALPGGLVETELFGYMSGVYTGRDEPGRAGKLMQSSGGTLLLKDIEKLPLNIQLKLLQFMKSGAYQQLGGEQNLDADTRIIATTSTSLQSQMEHGYFLEELFYLLNVMSIEIPPLRERTEDLPELVQAFVSDFALQYNKHVPKIHADVMARLMNYDWPGNIRELRNVIERMIILYDGGIISEEHLPQGLVPEEITEAGKTRSNDPVLVSGQHGHDENALIYETLLKVYGNKSAAAKLLGISRGTLYKKMREYGIKF